MTVALDAQTEAARPWIEAAKPSHPSLIDHSHVVDELFGITNVPMSVWIDEDGEIVRPPEVAFSRRPAYKDMKIPDGLDPYLADVLAEASKIRIEPEKYVAALRDWVSRGKESPYALPPDEVLRRSRPRPPQEAEAAAHFELGRHLHEQGKKEAAYVHFRHAHRLQPDNWTYKRQAWSFVNPLQGPSDEFEGDWLTNVREVGAENYYPPLDM